ncbi:MAG: metallophosphoesterase family protein, partial [Desulfobacteraceae bacterium]
VHGNMDPVEVKVMLPEKKLVDLGGYRFGLIHGWGPSEGLEERVWDQFQNVDVIIYGHSHKSANYVREGTLLFNPGTATGFTSSGMHSIGVLECGDALRGDIIHLD